VSIKKRVNLERVPLVVVYLEDLEKTYWTHEVSKELKIGESTLRKWCMELEKNGYTFVKGAMDSRAFTDHDLVALNYFKQLYKAKKHSREKAAQIVVDKFSRKGGNERVIPFSMAYTRSVEHIEAMIEELLEQNKKQEEFNKSLIERLNQQDLYIKKLIKSFEK
jgi:hypothetical protein